MNTNYVIPFSEAELPLKAELGILGYYGLTKELAVSCVVNEMVNQETNGVEEVGTVVFQAIEEKWRYIGQGELLDVESQIDGEFKLIEPAIISVCNKICNYIAPYLHEIVGLEIATMVVARPLQFSVNGYSGHDIVVQVM